MTKSDFWQSRSHTNFVFPLQLLRSELKEREHLVNSTMDQARMFLADQPIEGPGEPRMNLQPKTGTFTLSVQSIYIFLLVSDWEREGH